MKQNAVINKSRTQDFPNPRLYEARGGELDSIIFIPNQGKELSLRGRNEIYFVRLDQGIDGEEVHKQEKICNVSATCKGHMDPNYDEGPDGDRVFVRVDLNPVSFNGFGEEAGDDPDSIFADPPEDDDDVEIHPIKEPSRNRISNGSSLPDHIRKEILDLGFPDDGYNYLLHLREIKNNGGGSAFYENSKAKLEQLPHDVKAYDASRVPVLGLVDDNETNENSIYSVAAKTVGVRIKKAADEEVAALLDDDDLSRFGSDIEDLEEDFVVQANLLEGDDGIVVDKKINEQPEVIKRENIESENFVLCDGEFVDTGDLRREQTDEKPRVSRL